MNKFNIYLDILRTGLENIRRATRAGDIRQAMLERDHIAEVLCDLFETDRTLGHGELPSMRLDPVRAT